MKTSPCAIHASTGMILSALLCACGGGGNPDDSELANKLAILPTSAAVDHLPIELLAQMPSATYAENSQERLVYRLLNAERIRCGFGPLRQNASLDAAAKAHARWGVINNQISHTESLSQYPNGFTGTSVTERARAQGYSSQYLGEVFSGFTNFPSTASEGVTSVRQLMNAPYHMRYMTDGFREIGISVQKPADVGLSAGMDLVVTELGVSTQDTYQDVAENVVTTYPCDGSSEVAYNLNNETPNPVPGRDLATQPLGSSIIMRVNRQQKLLVDNISITQTQTGAAVKLRPMVGGFNGTADPLNEFNAAVAYVAADAPMQPNTMYTVQINGQVKGPMQDTPFNKKFNFSTGNLYLPSF